MAESREQFRERMLQTGIKAWDKAEGEGKTQDIALAESTEAGYAAALRDVIDAMTIIPNHYERQWSPMNVREFAASLGIDLDATP